MSAPDDLFSFEPIVDALASKLAASGYYGTVNQYDGPAGNTLDMFASVFIADLRPYARGSGLNSTTMLLVYTVRIWCPIDELNPDRVDPRALRAAGALWQDLHGDFDLSGPTGTAPAGIRGVDLLGEAGTPPRVQPGYGRIADRWYRTQTVTVPVIVNDLFAQVR